MRRYDLRRIVNHYYRVIGAITEFPYSANYSTAALVPQALINPKVSNPAKTWIPRLSYVFETSSQNGCRS